MSYRYRQITGYGTEIMEKRGDEVDAEEYIQKLLDGIKLIQCEVLPPQKTPSEEEKSRKRSRDRGQIHIPSYTTNYMSCEFSVDENIKPYEFHDFLRVVGLPTMKITPSKQTLDRNKAVSKCLADAKDVEGRKKCFRMSDEQMRDAGYME